MHHHWLNNSTELSFTSSVLQDLYLDLTTFHFQCVSHHTTNITTALTNALGIQMAWDQWSTQLNVFKGSPCSSSTPKRHKSTTAMDIPLSGKLNEQVHCSSYLVVNDTLRGMTTFILCQVTKGEGALIFSRDLLGSFPRKPCAAITVPMFYHT